MTTLLTIFLVIFVLCSGALSASETSLFSLSPMHLSSMRKGEGRRKRLVVRLLSKPRELLVTLLMLNVAMNILVQNVVSSLFDEFPTWWISVGVPLFITLIFGEVIPKTLAMTNNQRISTFFAPYLYLIGRFISPIRRFLTWLTSAISHFFFFFLKSEKEISFAELKHAMKTSREYGILSPEESKLIGGYLNLQEDIVKEVMTPRQVMLAFDINEPIEQLYSLFVDQECSRIPVYDGDPENILGILTAEQLFRHKDDVTLANDIKPLLKKPYFVPETVSAKELIASMNEKGEGFALVVDEYGALSGLITKEDLIEVVIGQIEDKRDEKSLFTRSSDDTIIASGKLELTELEEIFDTPFESPENMATIGGWLTEQFEDIPSSGEKLETEHFLFYILDATPTRIRRVYIRKLPQGGK